MAWFTKINGQIHSFVWGPVMLVFLLGIGIYFTVKTGFFQATQMKLWLSNTIGKLFRKKEAGHGAVTPFQAFTTAMAATAGTGNLVGVGTAILLGGPGVVFWMWVSGLFGMMTKYAEIVLAIHFRKRDHNGDFVGGPMYYIREGLGKRFSWLAILFAIFGSLAAFGIGNMTQISAIAGTAESMLIEFGVFAPGVQQIFIFRFVLGIILAVLIALVLFGGIKRIGTMTEALIPFVGLLTIFMCIIAVIIKADQLPTALASILQGAFQPRAAAGGILGYTFMQALKYGVARGVFTNEAGLGSAPIAHAAAETKGPVDQGMWGVFEVFADTLVMCTLSALVILTSGVFTGVGTDLDGTQIISAAFAASFGKTGIVLLTISILLFAYATILSWSLYGLRCFEYLTGGRGSNLYLTIFCGAVIVAAVMELDLIWDIADTLNGLMAIPNLVALIGLAPIVLKLTREYLTSKQQPKQN